MEGMLKSVGKYMFDLMVMGILSGLAVLVAFEIFQEARGASRPLHDRYHE